MRPITAVATGALLLAGSLAAQTRSEAAGHLPPLLSTTAVRADDSPLVKAAKVMAEKRRAAPAVKFAVNNHTLVRASGGRIAFASGELPPLPTPAASTGTGQVTLDAPPPSTEGTEAANRRIAALKEEQARMAAEAEEPYGGDMDIGVDDVDARRAQNQQELLRASQPQPTTPPQP